MHFLALNVLYPTISFKTCTGLVRHKALFNGKKRDSCIARSSGRSTHNLTCSNILLSYSYHHTPYLPSSAGLSKIYNAYTSAGHVFEGVSADRESRQAGLASRTGDGVQEHSGPSEWKAVSSFKELTYWNHDTCPTRDDRTRRSVDWLQLAAAVRVIIAFTTYSTPK